MISLPSSSQWSQKSRLAIINANYKLNSRSLVNYLRKYLIWFSQIQRSTETGFLLRPPFYYQSTLITKHSYAGCFYCWYEGIKICLYSRTGFRWHQVPFGHVYPPVHQTHQQVYQGVNEREPLTFGGGLAGGRREDQSWTVLEGRQYWRKGLLFFTLDIGKVLWNLLTDSRLPTFSTSKGLCYPAVNIFSI